MKYKFDFGAAEDTIKPVWCYKYNLPEPLIFQYDNIPVYKLNANKVNTGKQDKLSVYKFRHAKLKLILMKSI